MQELILIFNGSESMEITSLQSPKPNLESPQVNKEVVQRNDLSEIPDQLVPLESSNCLCYFFQILLSPFIWIYEWLFSKKPDETDFLEELNDMSSPLTQEDENTLSQSFQKMRDWEDGDGNVIFQRLTNPDVAYYLLSSKPNLDYKNRDGKKAITYLFELAIQKKNKELFGELLDCYGFYYKDFDFDEKILGNTLYTWAIQYGWDDLADRLKI